MYTCNKVITLDRKCLKENLVKAEAEVQALVSENCADDDVAMYTDRSDGRENKRRLGCHNTNYKIPTVGCGFSHD